MSMDQVNLIIFQKGNQPSDLSGEVEIVKTRQRIIRNFTKAETISLGTQQSLVLQTSEIHFAASAFAQETQQLNGLTFGAARLKAVDDVQDPGFHVNSPQLIPIVKSASASSRFVSLLRLIDRCWPSVHP